LPGTSSAEIHQPTNSKTPITGDHSYVLQSPRQIKRKLDTALSALVAAEKKLKLAQQCNRRLQKRMKNVKDLLAEMQKKQMITEHAEQNLLSSFDDSAFDRITRRMRSAAAGKLKARYPIELRNFALSLHFYSAKAYDFVRSQFGNCLPHPKTLANWYSCIDGNPGFHDEIFAALRCMSESRIGNQPICSLMMDEMAIRRQVEWDGRRYVGYVDMGVAVEDNSNLPVAKEALVLMIVSMTEHWKVPVAYFLIDGLQGKERANLVRICLQKLHDAGIKIVSLTFDGCSANCAMALQLGARLDAEQPQSSFEHPSDPNERVCIFLDACHMVKLMRNMLADKGSLLDVDNQEIKWAYIENLQALQTTEGLRAGNKLHERHVQWKQQKMKVKLAVQALSASVANALEFCQTTLDLPQFQGCEATVKFIRTIDRLFDFLNSRNPIARGYKAPMRMSNAAVWRPFVAEAQEYLRGLKLASGQLVSQSLRKTAVIGLIMSSMSAVSLFDTLVKDESALKYLLTYKASQDHLELFFSAVRSRGGWNNNPSAVHLKAAWKKLLAHQQLKEVKTGNCVAQMSCPVLTISSRIDRQEKSDVATVAALRLTDALYKLSDENTDSETYGPQIDLSMLSNFVENVVVYISGFVVRKVAKRLACTDCRAVLYWSKASDELFPADFGLLEIKDRGGLLRPSHDVVHLCKASESRFRSTMGPFEKPVIAASLKAVLITDVLRSFIGSSIFSALMDHSTGTEPIRDHRVLLMKTVVDEYLTCRLHHQGKCFTRSIHEQNKRSTLNKTVIFSGQ
jgi:DNA transposase THAP9